MARRSGRRPGNQDTREQILAAARETFAERGYDATSVRGIATSAGVDPALVHHYFGTKDNLFLETVRPPIDPAEIIPHIFADANAADQAGERLVRTFLGVWEDPDSGPAFASLIRGAISHRWTGRLVREFFTVRVVRRVLGQLDLDVPEQEVPLRAGLVASQLFGLALARYVIGFEPLASQPIETVVRAVAPTIQRYLTGEVDFTGASLNAADPTTDDPGQV